VINVTNLMYVKNIACTCRSLCMVLLMKKYRGWNTAIFVVTFSYVYSKLCQSSPFTIAHRHEAPGPEILGTRLGES
jgi:hypothetical protein